MGTAAITYVAMSICSVAMADSYLVTTPSEIRKIAIYNIPNYNYIALLRVV